MTSPQAALEQLSDKLQRLYSLVLAAEREFHPQLAGLSLLDKLVNDPEWAWLRPLSTLTAEIDHVLSQPEPPTEYDHAVVAARLRGLLAGEGDLANETFLQRYRPLLPMNPELAHAHGELRALLKSAPTESANEAERLHARHQWAMRCKHRGRGSQA